MSAPQLLPPSEQRSLTQHATSRHSRHLTAYICLPAFCAPHCTNTHTLPALHPTRHTTRHPTPAQAQDQCRTAWWTATSALDRPHMPAPHCSHTFASPGRTGASAALTARRRGKDGREAGRKVWAGVQAIGGERDNMAWGKGQGARYGLGHSPHTCGTAPTPHAPTHACTLTGPHLPASTHAERPRECPGIPQPLTLTTPGCLLARRTASCLGHTPTLNPTTLIRTWPPPCTIDPVRKKTSNQSSTVALRRWSYLSTRTATSTATWA
mmetsp:Transcript_3982/g.11349  ORF Transcript_3982/g.11349 Transcript_3982/m.11349 type:complete len:267 (+) Transcript_3982:1634-2434(+)